MPIGNVGPDGRLRDGFILVDGPPTGKHDFTKLPDLQPDYMSHSEHKTEQAIAYLRSKVKGFFVEMPLAWGDGEKNTPQPPLRMESMIAEQQERKSVDDILEGREEEQAA